MHYKFSHYLITGANGFIGRNLSKHLKSLGATVTAILRNKPSNIETNFWDQIIIHDFNNSCEDSNYQSLLNKIASIENKKIEAIIHLANIAHNNKENFLDYWHSNIRSTLDLFEIANALNIKAFLYLSSTKAVQCPSNKICLDETYTFWPKQEDYYGISKRIAEELLIKAAKNSNIHTTILRPALVYGPHVKGHLALLIKAAKQQLLPNLPNMNNKISMIHVEDLVTAILIAISNNHTNKNIFIVTDNLYYSTNQICTHIKKQVNRNYKIYPWYFLPLFLALNLGNKITVPYLLLQIIAKVNDFLQFITSKFNKNVAKKFFFTSQQLQKMFASNCFSSKKLQNTINWHPKHSFLDYQILD